MINSSQSPQLNEFAYATDQRISRRLISEKWGGQKGRRMWMVAVAVMLPEGHTSARILLSSRFVDLF
jgi:hypothetical protein